MKKAIIISLLTIGFIFQNCKNNTTQKDLLPDNETEQVIEQEVDTVLEKDNTKGNEEISSTSESEVIQEVVTEMEEKKEESEINKIIDEEVEEVAEEIVPVIKEETIEKEIVKEEVVEQVVETETKIEKIIEDEEKEITEVKEIIEKTPTISVTDKWIVPEKYNTMKNPTNPNEDRAIGKSLYSKHCKSCHGAEGYGDGPKADEMDGDLGDFSSEDFQAQSDGALFYKTTIGRLDMPEYTKKIPDDEDRWLIVNYMRALAN